MSGEVDGVGRLRPPGWWPRVQTQEGDALVAGPTVVTPIAKTLTIGSDAGGFLCRRSWPSAVSVATGAQQSRVRIVDVTRLIQLAIVLAAALLTVGVWMWTKTRKER